MCTLLNAYTHRKYRLGYLPNLPNLIDWVDHEATFAFCLQAVEFLELVKKFKEYGFKENNIMDCLQAANNDGEKALEYLMTLSST